MVKKFNKYKRNFLLFLLKLSPFLVVLIILLLTWNVYFVCIGIIILGLVTYFYHISLLGMYPKEIQAEYTDENIIKTSSHSVSDPFERFRVTDTQFFLIISFFVPLEYLWISLFNFLIVKYNIYWKEYVTFISTV